MSTLKVTVGPLVAGVQSNWTIAELAAGLPQASSVMGYDLPRTEDHTPMKL